MTDRVLKAIECPWVDVLGHPTGRRLLQREPLHGELRPDRHRRGSALASRSRSTASRTGSI